MQDEVTASKLKIARGKKVEVLAFGVSYVGKLTKVDSKSGLVRVEDGEDYVLLEIERIDRFRIVRSGLSSTGPHSRLVKRRSSK